MRGDASPTEVSSGAGSAEVVYLFARVGFGAGLTAILIALTTGGSTSGPFVSSVSLFVTSAAALRALALERPALGARLLLVGVFAVLVASAALGGGAASGAPTMAVSCAAVAALLVGFPAARWYSAAGVAAFALLSWLAARGVIDEPEVPLERRMIYVAAHVVAAAAIVLRPVHRLHATLAARRDAVAAAEDTARTLYAEEAELAREVSRRTEDLVEANRGLESFRYALSHDLRAPLRAILGFSAAAREDHAARITGELAADLDAIESDAREIDRTITSVLDEVVEQRDQREATVERAPLPSPAPPFEADVDAARSEMVSRLTRILFVFPLMEILGALGRPRPAGVVWLAAVDLAYVIGLALAARRGADRFVRDATAVALLVPALVAPFLDGDGLRSPYLVGAVGATYAIGFFMPRGWSAAAVAVTLVDVGLLRLAHARGWIPEQPLDRFAMVAGTATDVAFALFFLERPLALVIEAERRTREALARQRALLDALERATSELEERVATQTASLVRTHERLDASARTLADALGAPLVRVAERADRIVRACRGAGDEDAAATVERIHNAAVRMREMIGALLTLSRASGTGMQVQRIEADEVARIVDELVSELLHGAARDRVEVRSGPYEACDADPALLRTVLANLLSNAIKYSRERERAHVEVRCEGGELVVRDDGVGFDAAGATDLFGVFRRMHPKARFEGHGIGLATVRRIVVRHGGTLRAISAPGEGAELRVRLSRADARA